MHTNPCADVTLTTGNTIYVLNEMRDYKLQPRRKESRPRYASNNDFKMNDLSAVCSLSPMISKLYFRLYSMQSACDEWLYNVHDVHPAMTTTAVLMMMTVRSICDAAHDFFVLS